MQAVVRAERLRRREVRRMSGPLETFSPEVKPPQLRVSSHCVCFFLSNCAAAAWAMVCASNQSSLQHLSGHARTPCW